MEAADKWMRTRRRKNLVCRCPSFVSCTYGLPLGSLLRCRRRTTVSFRAVPSLLLPVAVMINGAAADHRRRRPRAAAAAVCSHSRCIPLISLVVGLSLGGCENNLATAASDWRRAVAQRSAMDGSDTQFVLDREVDD